VHRRRHAQDQQRDEDLAALGVRIVRLLNCDVIERLDAVLDELTRCCERIADGCFLFPPLRGGKGGMEGR
jgi:very-short-patch-repair endonuclease